MTFREQNLSLYLITVTSPVPAAQYYDFHFKHRYWTQSRERMISNLPQHRQNSVQLHTTIPVYYKAEIRKICISFLWEEPQEISIVFLIGELHIRNIVGSQSKRTRWNKKMKEAHVKFFSHPQNEQTVNWDGNENKNCNRW